MGLKPVHIVLGGGVLVFGLLLNAKFGVVDAATGRILLFGGVAVGVVVYIVNGDFGSSDMPGYKQKEITPNEAIPHIQDYLEKAPGKNKLWLQEDSDDRQKIHDDTRWINRNGKEEQLYAIVARPYNKYEKRPYEGEMVREIWNLTRNTHVKYDAELPRYLGVESRIDPFANKDKWVENAGKMTDREEGGDQTFYIGSNSNSSKSSKSSSSSSDSSDNGDKEEEDQEQYGDSYAS